MASDVDPKQNEATCSNKTKPKLIIYTQNETTQLHIFYYSHKVA